MHLLIKTYLVLLTLTAFSLGASFLKLGAWETPVALAFAASKSAIVAMIFMRLVRAPASFRFAALLGVGFVVLLSGLAMSDVTTR